MTRIIILCAALLSPPANAEQTWRCTGIVTSSGSCIGSSSNVDPPIIRCDYDSNDPRCWRERR
jgi:hypothetical protein